MKKKYLLLVGLFIGLAVPRIVRAVEPANTTNVNRLMLDENKIYNSSGSQAFDIGFGTIVVNNSIAFGDNNTVGSVTMPSTTTASYFGIKVPFYNGSGAATARGQVILSSSTAAIPGGNMYGTSAAVLATTTILGVADGVYADGTKGWMTIAGYCAVLTTGTVNAGDILVSTAGSSGTGAAGYAGVTTGTEVVGTSIGKAMLPGTAAGGLTLTLMSR